jgi:hypothetical protein
MRYDAIKIGDTYRTRIDIECAGAMIESFDRRGDFEPVDRSEVDEADSTRTVP